MLDQTTDTRVDRYRAAWNKIDGGRAEWIEGSLELAVVLTEFRTDYSDNAAFGRWVERHGLRKIGKNDRAALISMAGDLTLARTLLEQTKRFSWQHIWANRPNRPQRTLPQMRKSPLSHRSGSSKRKRAAVIPTVMREDYVPGSIAAAAKADPQPMPRRRRAFSPPPKERPVPVLRGLTPEQVDPDFKGDVHEFARTYGLVNLQTKQQIEYHKQQELLMVWLGTMTEYDRAARAMLTARTAVESVTVQEWLRKPAKADKMRAWCKNIQLVVENLKEFCDVCREKSE